MPFNEQIFDLNTVLNSWEDEDLNRHFPIGGGRVLVRDGADGTWRGIVVTDQGADKPQSGYHT